MIIKSILQLIKSALLMRFVYKRAIVSTGNILPLNPNDNDNTNFAVITTPMIGKKYCTTAGP